MRRFPQSPTALRRRETRSPPPCARSIFHPLRRSKTGTPTLDASKSTLITIGSTKTSSCDDAKPFHFPVEPDAINDQCNRSGKRPDGAREVDGHTFYKVHPHAPRAGPERKQRRENDENDMESFKRHLAKDRRVV